MISAIDTNILLDILLPNKDFCDASAEALQESAQEGSLVICDIVYAELAMHFERQDECERFLADAQIRLQSLSREALFLSSRIWRQYRMKGGKRTRVLADFLVGAHAQMHATRLLSRDRGFYRSLFPPLQIVDPSRS